MVLSIYVNRLNRCDGAIETIASIRARWSENCASKPVTRPPQCNGRHQKNDGTERPAKPTLATRIQQIPHQHPEADLSYV